MMGFGGIWAYQHVVGCVYVCVCIYTNELYINK